MIHRYGFIVLVIVQISLLLVLVWQFQEGEKNSVTFTVITEDNWGYYQDSESLSGNEFLEFNINNIDKDVVSGTPKYSERLYVVVKEQDDIYEVKEASTTMLQPEDEEIMLVGKYMYDDDETNIYYVDYGFEYIDTIEHYGEFMYGVTLKVTVLYGEKWNQYNVIDMEKVTQ